MSDRNGIVVKSAFLAFCAFYEHAESITYVSSAATSGSNPTLTAIPRSPSPAQAAVVLTPATSEPAEFELNLLRLWPAPPQRKRRCGRLGGIDNPDRNGNRQLILIERIRV